MEQTKMKALENLEPAQLEKLLDIATNAHLIDCIDALKEFGIEVSKPTLSRFLKQHRAKILLESGEGVKGAVEALAERGESGAFRKGTMEAVRQRLFETALESENGEEARKLYVELLKEETKLKELELAERRIALAEDAERNRRTELRRRKHVALAAGAEPEKVENVELKLLPEAVVGEGIATNEHKEHKEGNVKQWRELVVAVSEILNRGGGSGEERVVEARIVLAGAQRLMAG